jgi:peptidoglycan/LPS O-acetylase OafA/YrhL
LVIYAGAQPLVQRVLAAEPLRRIGVASYSIYLLHEPIVSATMTALRPRYGDVAVAAALGAGLAAGFALWAVVERPLTRPETVAAFVKRWRERGVELFELTGIPLAVELRSSVAGAKLIAHPRQITPIVEKQAV